MENRKKQIIDLAVKLIQQKGYVAFSYDDISKQLGVTKASIHYHFKNKEDLGLAITERLVNTIQNFISFIKNSSDSAEEKLILFIQQQTERISCSEICPISSLQTDFESLPFSVQEKIKEVSKLELSIIQEIVIQAQTEKGGNNTEDIHWIALTILSSVKGAILHRRVMGENILTEITKQLNRFLRI